MQPIHGSHGTCDLVGNKLDTDLSVAISLGSSPTALVSDLEVEDKFHHLDVLDLGELVGDLPELSHPGLRDLTSDLVQC